MNQVRRLAAQQGVPVNDLRMWAANGMRSAADQMSKQARMLRDGAKLLDVPVEGNGSSRWTAAERPRVPNGTPRRHPDQVMDVAIVPTRTRRRRRLSAEARKRISDAQKRRWAKKRKEDAAKARASTRGSKKR